MYFETANADVALHMRSLLEDAGFHVPTTPGDVDELALVDGPTETKDPGLHQWAGADDNAGEITLRETRLGNDLSHRPVGPGWLKWPPLPAARSETDAYYEHTTRTGSRSRPMFRGLLKSAH